MARKRTPGRPTDWVFKGLKVEGSDRRHDVTIENIGQGREAAQIAAIKKAKELEATAVESEMEAAAAVEAGVPEPAPQASELEAVTAERDQLLVRVAELEAAVAEAPAPPASPGGFDPMAAATVSTNTALLLDRQGEMSRRLEADLGEERELSK